jgi:pimeloyl-ACP methyl ester carboxylesterase
MTPPPASEVRSADGTPIHFTSTGEGDTAVVLVHCWGCSARYWDSAVPKLARAGRVVAIDLAGHGSSGKDRKEWSIRSFAEDVRAVVDHLGLKRIALVGHSMGGPVVLEATPLLGDRVKGVALIDTVRDAGQKMSEEQRAKFFGAMRKDFKTETEKVVRSLFHKDADAKVVDKILADELAQDPARATAMLESSFGYPAGEALAKIKVPVRAIQADLRPTNVVGNRTFAPQYEAVVMKDVGHWPMIEQPEPFAELLAGTVEEWLDPTFVDARVPSSDGTPIHYRARGKGETAIVFVHGWCGSTRWWDPQLAHFSRTHRVIALDLAGHGSSARTRARWTVEPFGDDVRAVIDHSGVSRAVVVGHSMAGLIMLEVRSPKVSAVIAVEALEDVEYKMPDAEKDRALSALRGDFPKTARAMLGGSFAPTAPREIVDRVLDDAAAMPPEIAVPVLENAWAYVVADGVKKSTVPVMAINGTKYATKVDVNRRYAPGFKVVTIEGAGHWPMLEAPDRFNAALAELLE